MIHPHLEGSQLADMDSVEAMDLLAVLAGGAGVYEVMARREGLGEPERFTATAVYFEPWGWLLIGLESTAALSAAARDLTVLSALVAGVALVLLVGTLLWLTTRQISQPLGRAVEAVARVADGDLDIQFNEKRGDEIGVLYQALSRMTMQLSARLEADRTAAQENLRIRRALDSSETSVMIADREGQVIYANPSVMRLLESNASQLASQLPGFNPRDIVGESIDRFHESPGRQHRVLDRLNGSHRAEIRVGAATLRLTVSPVDDESGQRVGYVVEWLDRTRELAVEQELASIVESAAAGVLDRRVMLDDKQGFHRTLGEGINRILETNQASLLEIQRVLSAVADGDLTLTIDQEFEGAFGDMRRDMNRTVGQLRQIIGELVDAVSAIAGAAGEISSGNQDLARRTESQAASLEETAASMEQMTATVKQNAAHANQADALARQAARVATEGGEAVSSVVSTMDEIEQSSSRIRDIIGVIDNIAFQTNILALNAAVEAARAGEQGRGFAVVAAEVRTLAQRSAQAAGEIKALIEDASRRVEDGTRLVGEAGQTMQRIVSEIQSVTDVIGEIHVASEEQASGIEEVNRTITGMDDNTQQNAALVQQAAAAAQSLQAQSTNLSRVIGVFRLPAAAAQGGGAGDLAMPEKGTVRTLAIGVEN